MMVVVAQQRECIKLNTIELYTSKWSKWWILCYVYFTTIKKDHGT